MHRSARAKSAVRSGFALLLKGVGPRLKEALSKLLLWFACALLGCLLFQLSAHSALAQTCAVNTTAVVQGGTVVATWSGFSNNVNVEVWKGGALWVNDAAINQPSSGSWNLNTTGWELRTDYRVRILNRVNTAQSAFSGYFSVTVGAPTLSAPAAGMQFPSGSAVNFSWNAVSGASRYRIAICATSSLTSCNRVVDTIPLGQLSYTASDLPIGAWYWAVGAIGTNDAGGWGPYSTERRLVNITPVAPTLSSPSAGASFTSGSAITFNWNAVSGASRYRIAICATTSLTSCNRIVDTIPLGQLTYTASDLPIGAWYWAVGAIGTNDAGGWGPYSTERRLVNVTPVAPTLSSPSAGASFASGSAITFSWNAVSGASRYRIAICATSSLTSCDRIVDTIPLGQRTYAASDLPMGAWYWAVGAIGTNDAGGWGPYSTERRLINVTAMLPALIEPADNAAIHFPAADLNEHKITFNWGPVSSAVRYELWVDNNSGFGSREINELKLPSLQPGDNEGQCVPASPSSTQCTTPSNYFEQNLYYWKMRACFSSGSCTDWSEPRTFTVTYDDYPAPVFVPLRRFYHPADRDHYYTTSLSDNPSGYIFEKVEGYISDRPFPAKLFLMRLYHKTERSHRYVTGGAKRDAAIAAGYRYEGVAGFVYQNPEFGTVGLLHLYKGAPDYDDFLCITPAEITLALNRGYTDQNGGNPIGYVSPEGLLEPLGHRRHQGSLLGVDSSTGAYREPYSQQALAFHGFGPPFAFVIHHNSHNRTAVPLSPGWSHSFYAYVTEAVNGDVVVKWGDGSESFFRRQSDESFLALDAGNYDSLTRVSDGSNEGYDLVRKDQIKHVFRKIPVDDPSNSGLYVPPVVLIKIVDRHGNTIDINYFSNGRIQWVRDAALRTLSFSYDASGRLSQVTDAELNRTVRFGYDAAGNLQYVDDPRGGRTSLTYDADRRLLTVTRPRGNTPRRIDYDAAGRATRVLDHTGATMLAATYAAGSTRFTAGGIASRTVDLHHQAPQAFILSRVTDAFGKASEMAFTDPANPTLPSSVTDMRGSTTAYVYDARGNVTTITDALGKVARFTYDAKNNLTSSTDFRVPERKTFYVWDAQGKTLTDINAPLGRNTHFEYNPKGLPVSIRDGRSFTTTLGYDARFNLTSVTDPKGNVTQNQYDPAGRLLRVIDAKGKTTDYTHDNNDNLRSVRDHDGFTVNLHYDANNNLQQISYVRDGVQDVIAYTYDNNDRLTVVTDPLGGVQRYEYNDVGDLVQRTDALNRVTTYAYDNNGRLDRITYQARSETVQLGYDENGNLTSMNESWTPGSNVFAYDLLNRLTSHQNVFGQTVQFGYDDASNRNSIVYPGSGKTVAYGYDDANRLQAVTDWISGSVQYAYDAADNLQSLTNPNGTTATFNYDRASRLIGILHRRSNATTIASFDITLDQVGNHTSETTTGLLEAPPEPEVDISYTIGQDNRLISSSNGFAYGYDANGNRIQRTGPSGTTTYTYDQENRLIAVSGPGLSLQFMYDGLGNRVSRTENGTTTRYVLDLAGSMSHVLMETDASDNPLRYYIHGQHGLTSQITPGNQRYVYHGDSRGSVVAISDASENLAGRYTYDEVGAVLAEEVSGIVNPFKYVGRWGVMAEQDRLQFMRARYYDDGSGSFVSKDPLEFRGDRWSLYLYGQANPIRFFDPSGHQSDESQKGNKKRRIRKAAKWIADKIGTASDWVLPFGPWGSANALLEIAANSRPIIKDAESVRKGAEPSTKALQDALARKCNYDLDCMERAVNEKRAQSR